MRFSHILPAVIGVIASLPHARAATVTGTVIDAAMPMGQPIAFINIELRNAGDDQIIETVATDAMGVYSTTVPDSTQIYAVAKWEFSLRPIAFYNGGVVRLLDKIPGPPSTTYASKNTIPVDSGTGTLMLDITMDQVQPAGLTNMFTEIEATLNYVRLNKGSVPWQPNYDVPVHIRTDDAAFFDPAVDQSVHLPNGSFDGTGTNFDRVTLYHEVNHLIHYYLNGQSFPPTMPGCLCHRAATEEDPACALQEGWASYVGQLTAELAGVMSADYAAYRDPLKTHWRGGDWIPNNPPATTGCDTMPADNTFLATAYDGCPAMCRFESGEVVEGAVSGALFGWGASFGFDSNLRVVLFDRPKDIREFAERYANHVGGVDSPGAATMFAILADHGMVYTRARFLTIPIEIDEPLDIAAPDDGNVKQIDGTLFVRGQATAFFENASPASLGVMQAIGLREVRLEFGPATDDVNGSPIFVGSLPFVPATSGTLEFDTAGPGWQDGDCDLFLRAKNFYGFIDNAKPTWVGDGNIIVDTDEKYLKTIGGWYDKDRNPNTPAMDPAKEGKVIVDNTAPIVSGFTVGP